MKGFISIPKNKKIEILQFTDIKLENYTSYDFYRIVDPSKKTVLEFKDNILINTQFECCFSIFKKNQPCINCISRKVIEQKIPLTKFEFVDDSMFQIEAIPVIINDKVYSMELAKLFSNPNLSLNFKSNKLKKVVRELNSFFVKDSFTNLYNHKTTLEHLEYVLQNKKKGPVTIIQMDIDCMKQINDYFGHLAGDQTILKISEILREMDKVERKIFSGRIGGDEFISIFEGFNLKETEKIALFYMKKLQNIFPLEEQFPDLICSVSYGIKEIKKGTTIEETRYIVDKAMYNMKKINKPQKLRELKNLAQNYNSLI